MAHNLYYSLPTPAPAVTEPMTSDAARMVTSLPFGEFDSTNVLLPAKIPGLVKMLAWYVLPIAEVQAEAVSSSTTNMVWTDSDASGVAPM